MSRLGGTSGMAGGKDRPGALCDGPQGIGVDTLGNDYVTDTNNDTIRMITPAGVVSTLAGVAGVPGKGDSPAHFNFPTGLAIDASGNLYVGDSGNHTIPKITTPAGVMSHPSRAPRLRASADGTRARAKITQ